jgi:hypothetical protein
MMARRGAAGKRDGMAEKGEGRQGETGADTTCGGNTWTSHANGEVGCQSISHGTKIGS